MMADTDFAYASTGDVIGSPFNAAILADDADLRAEWCEESSLVGISPCYFGCLSGFHPDLLPGPVSLVFVRCHSDDPDAIFALAQLDQWAAKTGTELIVESSVLALDAVFFNLDESQSQILVDPTQGERLVALGRVMSGRASNRLHELSEDVRISLLRLTEQVAEIADRLDRIGQKGLAEDGGAFRFESPGAPFKGEAGAERALVKRPKPPLPDARLVRKVIQQRQLRARFFPPELFADPAWDILLDLTASRVERRRVSVTSLCIASGVPPTTALRWISQLIDVGLLERQQDELDRRRAFIALTDKGAESMARYFAELGKDAPLTL